MAAALAELDALVADPEAFVAAVCASFLAAVAVTEELSAAAALSLASLACVAAVEADVAAAEFEELDEKGE